MKKNLVLIGILFSFSLFAQERTEELLGFGVDAVGVIFQVPSSGCTDKDSFKVESLETDPVQLRLVRIKEDICELQSPWGTKVKYSYDELSLEKGQKFSIYNPLAVLRAN